MMDTLKPYPEYKESGLEWLGCIPKNWDIIRTKGLFQLSIEKSGSHHGMELLSIYTHIGVKPRKDLEERGNKASNTDGYWIVRKGDLIVNKLLAWMGAVGVSHYEGVTSPAYDILRPRRSLNSNFYHYLFRTKTYLQQFKARSRGIMDMRLRLYFDQLGQIPSVVPPKIDQDTIVNYLRVLDLKVNCFIRNRRRLIEVLNEQKHAIINQAVTLGLDPDVLLKPSGIDGLGEVPENWNILPFTKYAIERADYRGATPEKVDSGIFLVTAKNIRKGWIDYEVSKEYVRTEDFSVIMRRGLPQCDDLLLTMEAPLGHIALVDREDIALAQRLVRFRMSTDHFMPKFVLHSALSAYFQNQMLCRGTGSTAIGIKASKLPQLRILQPSLKEQAEIVAKIDRVSAPMLDAIAKAQSEIDLIREYRTRLISDVVTGKIDVRHLVPPPGSEDLEEVAEALEPLDDVMADVEIDEEEEVNESD